MVWIGAALLGMWELRRERMLQKGALGTFAGTAAAARAAAAAVLAEFEDRPPRTPPATAPACATADVFALDGAAKPLALVEGRGGLLKACMWSPSPCATS